MNNNFFFISPNQILRFSIFFFFWLQLKQLNFSPTKGTETIHRLLLIADDKIFPDLYKRIFYVINSDSIANINLLKLIYTLFWWRHVARSVFHQSDSIGNNGRAHQMN